MSKLINRFLLFCYKFKRYDLREGLFEALNHGDKAAAEEFKKELIRINAKIHKLS